METVDANVPESVDCLVGYRHERLLLQDEWSECRMLKPSTVDSKPAVARYPSPP